MSPSPVRSHCTCRSNTESLNGAAVPDILRCAAIKQDSPEISTAEQNPMRLRLFLVLLGLVTATSAWPASFYTQRLEDPTAVYVAPSGSDDTAALQNALNRVQETTGQGIVLLAPGRYRLSDTVYIWPGIRLIGYGAQTGR